MAGDLVLEDGIESQAVEDTLESPGEDDLAWGPILGLTPATKPGQEPRLGPLLAYWHPSTIAVHLPPACPPPALRSQTAC